MRLADERLTTVSAQRSLREAGVRAKQQRGVIDQAAAVSILQGWLDQRRNLLSTPEADDLRIPGLRIPGLIAARRHGLIVITEREQRMRDEA